MQFIVKYRTHWLDWIARVFFALTLVLIPLHWRVTLHKQLSPPVYADYTDYLLFAPDVTIISMLFLWGISHRLTPRPIKLGPAHIWLPLFGLTAAGWLSTLTAEYRELSAYHVIRLVILFGFYLYIVNEVNSTLWVMLPVTIQLILQSGVAMGQFWYQHSIGLQTFGEFTLDPGAAGVSIVSANGIRLLRAYGLTGHPNILGGCLAFGLILLLAVILHGGKQMCWLAAFAFLPAALALAQTFSRSAWLAFLGGSLLLIGAEVVRRQWEQVRRASLLAFASVFVIAPFVWQNLTFFRVRLNVDQSFENVPAEQQSIGERGLLIRSANRIFVEHPINGIGLAAAPLAMKDYYPDFPVNYQPPHYTLLAVAVETGLIGAVFYFFLMTLPAFTFFSKRKTFVTQPVMVACAALLLAVVIVGFFDYYTWSYDPGRLWQWLAWGLWSAAVERAQ